MARGYPAARSALAGTTLALHVASDAAKVRFDIFRRGAALSYVGSSDWFDGPAPTGAPAANADFGWTAMEFEVPGDWSSGVYIASIVEWDGAGDPPAVAQLESTFATDSLILFVVRSGDPGVNATILYKLSLFTYHAYNITGDGAFYVESLPSTPPDPPGAKVTLLRPGGGTGGDLAFTDPDFYDPNAHPQTFSYWDEPFIAWLESQGYRVDYCTDLDVHTDLGVLANYRLLLSVGHDEYWSAPMRANVESFIASGGNVPATSAATLAGGACTSSIMTPPWLPEDHPPIRDGDQWWLGSVNQAGKHLTGCSYRNAGGFWTGKRPVIGYHPVCRRLVVRWDRSHRQRHVWSGRATDCGIRVRRRSSGRRTGPRRGNTSFTDQTPRSFAILGVGLLDGQWDLPPRKVQTMCIAATMGVWANNGVVFSGATCEWPRVVGYRTDAAAVQITKTTLDALSKGTGG